jgi:osmotically-inducible protein OsmY
MSDWNRGRREDDPSFYGDRSRGRPDEIREARWPGEAERRAFDDARTDPERGGYGRHWEDSDGGPGFERYGMRGEKDYRGDVYRTRDERAGTDYGPVRGETVGYDEGGVIGRNPALDRVAFGEADHPWRDDLGEGRHRGRGPKNYVRSDERIREDVSDRLSDDAWLDASNIEVTVAAAEVTLTGVVADRRDKRRAEDLADDVRGVRHVQNNLRCRPAEEDVAAVNAEARARAAETRPAGQGPLG